MVFESYNPNMTHQEALTWAVAKTKGPVVEIAMGWYSTLMLHGMCEGLGRELYSVDPLEEWVQPFRRFESNQHHIICDDTLSIPVERAGVVFVDHNHPVVTRAEVIRAARSVADIVVVHDSEPGKQEAYPGVFTCFIGMEDAINEYAHRRDWRAITPFTTALWDGDKRIGPVTRCLVCGGENVKSVYRLTKPPAGVQEILCKDCGGVQS